MHSQGELPKILVPYRPTEGGKQDIVIYLRPETNGVQVESAIFKAFQDTRWSQKIDLVYLANLPGSYILQKRMVEKHYALRLEFAAQGKEAFTQAMKTQFSRFFGIPFDKAKIYGAFEALQILNLSAEELFQLWVPVYDILEIEGQLIKRTKDNLFIINYDIPALLHKNHAGTDVAVLVARTALDYGGFRPVINEIRKVLVNDKLLDPLKPEGRIFHYSKTPFEQLLDGMGYVLNSSFNGFPLSGFGFGNYLLSKGEDESSIIRALKSPIGLFKTKTDEMAEQNLYTYTLFDDFETAWKKYHQGYFYSIHRTV